MKLRIIYFCFILILLTTSLNAGINLTCAGARAAGMGGAFIGVADDATAVIWNPGGLTQLYRPEASIGTKYNSSKSKFVGWENTESNFVLDFVSVAYPFMDSKLVAVAAYQRPMDLYIDFETDYETVDCIGGADTFTIGLAYRILSFLSAGISTNLWFGSIEYKNHYYEHDYSSSWEEWYDYEFVYEFNQAFSGFNMIFGGLIDLDNLEDPIPLKLGVTYRTAFDLKAKEEGLITEEIYFELGDHFYYEVEIDSLLKNEILVMLGFGASYCFSDKFTLSVDYEKRAYSNSNVNQHNNDLNQFRFGTEYLFVTDFIIIPLRAGYQTVPTLMADITVNQIIGSGYSFGTGLIFDRVVFDIAFTRATNENFRGYYGNQDTSYTKFIFSGIIYF